MHTNLEQTDRRDEHGADTLPPTATIVPWVDPVVDRRGHDPRSLYVEQFYVGILGPTATWVLRRFAAHLDRHPAGGPVDLRQLAGSLGLSLARGTTSPFGRAIQRCVMFGTARPLTTGVVGWEVRRRLPTVAHRHLRKLPDDVQRLHAEWDHTPAAGDSLSRAHRLAAAMVETGDPADVVEAQLLLLGVNPRAASTVCEHLRAS